MESHLQSTLHPTKHFVGEKAKQQNQTGSVETPFTAGAQDAFGVSLGEVYDMMEPIGSTTSVDLGAFT